jgi:hypothetical protein
MDPKNESKQRAQELVERLQGNAELMEQMEGLLALVESEQAMGRSADEIEQEIIVRLRVLGKSSLQGWAQRANEAACGEAKGHVHKKKGSGGWAVSAALKWLKRCAGRDAESCNAPSSKEAACGTEGSRSG